MAKGRAGRSRGTAAAVLLTGVLMAGCSTAGAPEAPAPDPAAAEADGAAPSVIVPGRPGEEARVVSPEEAEALRPAPEVSPADVEFVTMMIPHHEQALLMAGLAPDRVADPQVRSMAERIAASQGPEIQFMRSWLEERGLPATSGHAGHDMGSMDMAGMPGMATPPQLAALIAARGPAFDRLFLDLMIVHHRGALDMAGRAQIGGRDIEALRLADDVVSSQSAEIDRMTALYPA